MEVKSKTLITKPSTTLLYFISDRGRDEEQFPFLHSILLVLEIISAHLASSALA